MRTAILIALVIFGLAAVACTSEEPSPADTQTASPPTPDVPATVEASILSTREAETAIDATVEAKVAETLTITTSTPRPTNTPEAPPLPTLAPTAPQPTSTTAPTTTPAPMNTPRPAATPNPTATPYPTTTPAPTEVAALQPTPTTAPTATRPTSTPLPTLTVSPMDDHGNDFEGATRIAIGEAVTFELENNDDIDALVFRARPGTEFLLTLNWEYYEFRENYTESPLLAVYRANGQEQMRLMGYELFETGGPSIGLEWRAVTGGDYYIVIGDGNTKGVSAFSISQAEATEPVATPAPTAPPTPPASSFVSVSAGSSHTCGVRSDGSVACWGNATPPAGSRLRVARPRRWGRIAIGPKATHAAHDGFLRLRQRLPHLRGEEHGSVACYYDD